METTEVIVPEQTLNATPPPPEQVTPEIAEPETPPEAETPEDESSKALKRMERRIARLTAAKYETAAEANQARQEAESLRQRLAQYEQQQEPQAVRPEDVLSLAERIAASKLEQQNVVTSIKSVLEKGKRIAGFDEACNSLNEVLPFYEHGKPTPFLRVVMEAEAPAKVLHYLGSNPDVAEDLIGLTATQQARRIARIEADLDAPVQKVSKAPKALTPLKGNTADTGGLSDNLPIEEWAKRFRQRIRG